MSGLGAAMAGGNPRKGRKKDDFYPTPWEVTAALMKIETFDGPIWEPACGDGAMVSVIRRYGYRVVASDLNPRCEAKRIDFLAVPPKPSLVGINFVTNPPFSLALKFIERGLALQPRKMALMLKSTYWHAIRRLPIFEEHKPAWVYPLTWRPDFSGDGRPTMEVSWVVWHAGNTDWPRYRPLRRPRALPAVVRVPTLRLAA